MFLRGETDMRAEYGMGYLWGALVGIIAGVVLAAVLLKLTKKDGSMRCRYDERQEVVRGRGFKYGFFTMLIYFAAETLFGSFLELFADRSVISFIGLCLGVAVYAVYGIWKDAYISLNENPKRVIIVFFVIAAMILVRRLCTNREVEGR